MQCDLTVYSAIIETIKLNLPNLSLIIIYCVA